MASDSMSIQADGPTVFARACKLGLEGIVSKRKELALSQRPVTRLAQDEESERACDEAGRRRRLGQRALAMTET